MLLVQLLSDLYEHCCRTCTSAAIAPVRALCALELLAGFVYAQVPLEVRLTRKALAADSAREELRRRRVHHLVVRLQNVAILRMTQSKTSTKIRSILRHSMLAL